MLRAFWEAAAALDPEGAGPLMEQHDALLTAR